MTRDDIARIMAAHPTLHSQGMGMHPRIVNYAVCRQELAEAVEACALAERWLRLQRHVPDISTFHSSYGLKHRLDNDMRHALGGAQDICHGAVICAALFLDYRIRPCGFGSLSVFFNLGVSKEFLIPYKVSEARLTLLRQEVA